MFMCTAEAPENPAPDLGDRLHHHRGFGDAEARAAVLLRHRDAEPAVARQRRVEVGREAAFAVALEPVLVGEAAQSFAIASRMRLCSSESAKSITCGTARAPRPRGR